MADIWRGGRLFLPPLCQQAFQSKSYSLYLLATGSQLYVVQLKGRDWEEEDFTCFLHGDWCWCQQIDWEKRGRKRDMEYDSPVLEKDSSVLPPYPLSPFWSAYWLFCISNWSNNPLYSPPWVGLIWLVLCFYGELLNEFMFLPQIQNRFEDFHGHERINCSGRK